MALPTFRTAYGKRNRIKTSFKDSVSQTVQEQKDSTDVNKILERFNRTELIDHVNSHEPQYGDFTGYDFQTNQNKVAEAQSMFNALPAKVRQKFNHNPQEYLNYIADQANIDDMRDGSIDNPIESEQENQDQNDVAISDQNDGQSEA